MYKLTVFNSLLLLGILAGVITNAVLYGQTRDSISSLNDTLSNSTIAPFIVLSSHIEVDRFTLENIDGAFLGFSSTIVTYANFSTVTLSLGGAMAYTNVTLGYSKFVVSNVFPNGYPYTNQETIIPVRGVVQDGTTYATFSGKTEISVLPNGYDILVNTMFPPNGPPDQLGNIYLFPVSTIAYVVPK